MGLGPRRMRSSFRMMRRSRSFKIMMMMWKSFSDEELQYEEVDDE